MGWHRGGLQSRGIGTGSSTSSCLVRIAGFVYGNRDDGKQRWFKSVPRGSCFCYLHGREHGRWLLGPDAPLSLATEDPDVSGRIAHVGGCCCNVSGESQGQSSSSCERKG